MKKNTNNNNQEKFREKISDVTGRLEETLNEITDKAKGLTEKPQQAVNNILDVNNDGKIDINDAIIYALKLPKVKIDRSKFLKREFSRKFPEDVVLKAIASNPMQANITLEEIDKIADEIIKYERRCVSGISAALGLPGGAAVPATITVDIIQYYGYTLRAAQKLMYLYGFPEIQINEDVENLDTETINTLTITLGVMFGVTNASKALKSIAKALAIGVEKHLLKTALTKTTIYPIVKSISKWFGIKMTKSVYAGFFKKAIPVIGGALGGGLTYLMFKPSCDRLKYTLRDTMLSNPNYVSTEEDDIIDIETLDENYNIMNDFNIG